jgi:hypothetical protein
MNKSDPPQTPTDYVAGKIIPLAENGAYSWFSDPRAIVWKDWLVVGSVRAVENARTGASDPNYGNVDVSVCNLTTGKVQSVVLHHYFEQDDHDDPAFLPLPDDRLMAFYSKHAQERKAYVRISEKNDPSKWSEPTIIETPGTDARAYSGNNVTYSNPFRFPDGRIYNFYRGFGYDPNYMFSDDTGETWTYGGRVLAGKTGYGPYAKYAYDGDQTVHIIATEDHPRNYDNSLYHAMIRVRDGKILDSSGKQIGDLSKTTQEGIKVWDMTKIFQGDPDSVAWMCDIKLDSDKHPYVAFSVQKDGREKPRGEAGFDHRYYYARFDGAKWTAHEMAFGGTRLYRGEDDYTGLVALHPTDPDTVVISTDADPNTGAPLISRVDNLRHHELFRGHTADGGKTWTWTTLTRDSAYDNLRPMALVWKDQTVLVWMRGKYSNNHGEWTTWVVAMMLGK